MRIFPSLPMYKSRLYIEMCFWPGFSAQVSRNRVENWLNPRDMYKGEPFCRCFSVQVRLVQDPSSENQGIKRRQPLVKLSPCAVGESRICFCNQFIYNDLRKLEKKPGVK